MKKDIETRRMKAAERMKSMSSAEGDENFCPLSPRASAHKVRRCCITALRAPHR